MREDQRIRRGKRSSKTGAPAIRQLEQDKRMWNLRRDGLTLEQVGELENTDKTVVYRAIQRMFKRELPPDLEEQRALENARLDFVWAKIMPLLDDLDADTRIKAATACVRISARRAAMNCLDLPPRAPVDEDGRSVPPILNLIIDRAAAEPDRPPTASQAGAGV